MKNYFLIAILLCAPLSAVNFKNVAVGCIISAGSFCVGRVYANMKIQAILKEAQEKQALQIADFLKEMEPVEAANNLEEKIENSEPIKQ